MNKNQIGFSRKQSELGQSTVTVALTLGVLLLLIIGIVVLCLAFFTVSTMEDYDKREGLFDTLETQDARGVPLLLPEQAQEDERFF